jgi:hypothetical protein
VKDLSMKELEPEYSSVEHTTRTRVMQNCVRMHARDLVESCVHP